MNHNTLPVRDGDVGVFLHSPSHQNSPRQVLYVNGMQYGPEEHARDCYFLSAIIEGHTYGLYNLRQDAPNRRSFAPFLSAVRDAGVFAGITAGNSQTGSNVVNRIATGLGNAARAVGQNAAAQDAVFRAMESIAGLVYSFPADLAQCVRDWIRVHAMMKTHPVLAPLLRQNPDLSLTLTRLFLQDNLATLALFDLLRTNDWAHPELIIIAHSQGNLVTSAALFALEAIQPVLPRPTTVLAVASPSPDWRSGITVWSYSHADDFVAWLGGLASFNPRANIRLSGSIAAHMMTEYVRQNEFPRDLREKFGLPPDLIWGNTVMMDSVRARMERRV